MLIVKRRYLPNQPIFQCLHLYQKESVERLSGVVAIRNWNILVIVGRGVGTGKSAERVGGVVGTRIG
jgi:hypothetical protein